MSWVKRPSRGKAPVDPIPCKNKALVNFTALMRRRGMAGCTPGCEMEKVTRAFPLDRLGALPFDRLRP